MMVLPRFGLVLALGVAMQNASRPPTIVNVGLVATGTTSFHEVATRAGLRAAHTLDAYTACKDERCLPALAALLRAPRLDMGDPAAGPLGRAIREYDAISDIPMMHPAVVAQCPSPAATCVATNRSLESWIRSMVAAPIKGGNIVRLAYGMRRYGRGHGSPTAREWASTWRAHQRLLARHSIPTIDLEADDATKRSSFCAVAKPHFGGDAAACARAVGDAWVHAHATGASHLARPPGRRAAARDDERPARERAS